MSILPFLIKSSPSELLLDTKEDSNLVLNTHVSEFDSHSTRQAMPESRVC